MAAPYNERLTDAGDAYQEQQKAYHNQVKQAQCAMGTEYRELSILRDIRTRRNELEKRLADTRTKLDIVNALYDALVA